MAWMDVAGDPSIHLLNGDTRPIKQTVPTRAGRIGIKPLSPPPPYRMYFPNMADLEHAAIQVLSHKMESIDV